MGPQEAENKMHLLRKAEKKKPQEDKALKRSHAQKPHHQEVHRLPYTTCLLFGAAFLIVLFAFSSLDPDSHDVIPKKANMPIPSEPEGVKVQFNENRFIFTPVSDGIRLQVTLSQVEVLTAHLGLEGTSKNVAPTHKSTHDGCQFQYRDGTKMSAQYEDDCIHVQWQGQDERDFKDCFNIQIGDHWYGGGETIQQEWPLERIWVSEVPFVTNDMLSFSARHFGSLLTSYWISSRGVSIHVSKGVPLFFRLEEGQICLAARKREPYRLLRPFLSYHLCVGKNIKDLHVKNQKKFFQVPGDMPDEQMIRHPIWTTWALYHKDINQSTVLDYAKNIQKNGFNISQLEIDDHWETCYGEHQFSPQKFPDPKGMITELKNMGIRTSLWIHPFFNPECKIFNESQVHFVRGTDGKVATTGWWNSPNAAVLDTTNSAAVIWFQSLLEKLRKEIGIHSFKFDAGESRYLPENYKLNASENDVPEAWTHNYVKMAASFGNDIEIRSGRDTMDYPVFVRILDRDSRWVADTGIKSLVPVVLTFGLVGYPFVLPDMVGGNSDILLSNDKELFIRWLEVNLLMPSVQISIPPWIWDEETLSLTKKLLELRASFIEDIVLLAKEAGKTGIPINRPLWWIAPTDYQAFITSDQFLLGDKVLVAPVMEKRRVVRDVYLPQGRWSVFGKSGEVHEGPRWLYDYSAPLGSLPIFIRED